MNDLLACLSWFAVKPSRAQRAASVRFAVALCAVGLGLWPHLARAEWHSLTGPLPDHVGQINAIVSPDSSTVVFTADIDTDNVTELYAVAISTTTPIKLNPPLVNGGSVQTARVAVAPDSQTVFYIADQEVDNRNELFSVPIGGGVSTKLNGTLAAGGNVTQFKIDKDTNRIVYMADQETNEVFELWSVPIGGGTAVKLNGALVPGGNVVVFEIDPLSDRVVFSADAETDGKSELYSVPIAGGSVTKLNPPIVLTGGGDSGIGSNFAINPVVPVVVFIAREADARGGRVYSIPTAGGTPQQLSFNLLDTQRILHFLISPFGDRVVFSVGTRVGSTNAFKGTLHSNLIGAGGLADVTDTADPLFGTDNFRFLPDGSRVVYSFQKNAAAPIVLASATPLGVRSTLYSPGVSDPPLFNFVASNNSEWVMYQTSDSGLVRNVRMIPPTGGSFTNHGFGAFQAITPDSNRILYTRFLDAENHTDLFSAQVFGGGERNLSGMGGAGFVIDVRVSPDSKWVVFTAQVDGRHDLRASDGNEAQPPITGLSAANDGPKVVASPVAFTTVITGGEEISYTWDFGDGGSGSGSSTTHVYQQAGVYTATVTATGSANVVTATTTVYIGNAVVEVTDNQYTPQHVTIPHGGTVVWVLKEGVHSVTADDGSFEQPVGSDWPPFVHTFDHIAAASTNAPIAYHCSLHGASMSGTVTVTDVTEGGQNRTLLPLVRNE